MQQEKPSQIKKHRNLANFSAQKLRRARRLYTHLIYPQVIKNPQMAVIFAQRAHRRGLYSAKSSFRDVIFGICRAIFRDHRHKGYRGNWYEFWTLIDIDHIQRSVKLCNRFNGKVRIRVVA